MNVDISPIQVAKAHAFLDLHRGPRPVIVPCAWDAGSARLLTGLGFAALGISSAGIAFGKARRDGRGLLSRDEILGNARAVVQATRLPVTGDLENGFGDMPAQVAATVRLAAQAGLIDRLELVHVQAFIAQPSVEGFAQAIIRRLSRSREVELHAVLPGPVVKRLGGELGAMVDGDRARQRTLPGCFGQGWATLSPVSRKRPPATHSRDSSYRRRSAPGMPCRWRADRERNPCSSALRAQWAEAPDLATLLRQLRIKSPEAMT